VVQPKGPGDLVDKKTASTSSVLHGPLNDQIASYFGTPNSYNSPNSNSSSTSSTGRRTFDVLRHQIVSGQGTVPTKALFVSGCSRPECEAFHMD
jgi:hypothetical protein